MRRNALGSDRRSAAAALARATQTMAGFVGSSEPRESFHSREVTTEFSLFIHVGLSTTYPISLRGLRRSLRDCPCCCLEPVLSSGCPPILVLDSCLRNLAQSDEPTNLLLNSCGVIFLVPMHHVRTRLLDWWGRLRIAVPERIIGVNGVPRATRQMGNWA